MTGRGKKPARRGAWRYLNGTVLFGAVFMAVGGYFLASNALFVVGAQPVEAVVVEQRLVSADRTGSAGKAGGRHSTHSWHPAFRFQDAAGETHVLSVGVGTSGYNWPVGRRVVVLHNPAFDHVLVHDDSAHLWLVPGAFLLFGIVVMRRGLSGTRRRSGTDTERQT